MFFIKYFFSRIFYIFLAEVSYNTLYFISCVKEDLMRPHVILFILSQSFLEVSYGFSFKCRVFLRFDVISASITSHLYVLKLFLPSNFNTIFIECGVTYFIMDWLSSTISSVDSSKQCEKQLVKTNSNRKDQIFSSEQNCRQPPSWFVPLERISCWT